MATFNSVGGRRLGGTLALATVAFVASGCITKVVKTPVFDENKVQVYLREERRGGSAIERHFAQPTVIAPVRVTNLLARIEVRDGDKPNREPAVPTDLLYPIGEGVSRALAKADSNQEVVVMALERKRTLGVFTQDYLTSLVVWNTDGDKLYVKLDHLNWPVPKEAKQKKEEDLPEPDVAKLVGKNRAVPSDGIAAEGPQLIAANWRDPLFKDPGQLHVRPGGQVVRRSVLMDSGEEATLPAEPKGGAAPPPQGVSPEGLRALADLEESRRRGELTEADYQAKRREILAGEPLAAPKPGEQTGGEPAAPPPK